MVKASMEHGGISTNTLLKAAAGILFTIVCAVTGTSYTMASKYADKLEELDARYNELNTQILLIKQDRQFIQANFDKVMEEIKYIKEVMYVVYLDKGSGKLRGKREFIKK